MMSSMLPNLNEDGVLERCGAKREEAAREIFKFQNFYHFNNLTTLFLPFEPQLPVADNETTSESNRNRYC
jgi:hypothetical protein